MWSRYDQLMRTIPTNTAQWVDTSSPTYATVNHSLIHTHMYIRTDAQTHAHMAAVPVLLMMVTCQWDHCGNTLSHSSQLTDHPVSGATHECKRLREDVASLPPRNPDIFLPLPPLQCGTTSLSLCPIHLMIFLCLTRSYALGFPLTAVYTHLFRFLNAVSPSKF